jgi:hypothetical protein
MKTEISQANDPQEEKEENSYVNTIFDLNESKQENNEVNFEEESIG